MSFSKLPVLRHGLMLRHEDIFTETVMAERTEAARALMRKRNVESMVVCSDAINSGPVCYLTNYPCFGIGRHAAVALGLTKGPFLFTTEPARNLPRVRLFTTCDLERTRNFSSAACIRAKEISANGEVGFVGNANLSLKFAEDAEKELTGLDVKDLSRDFAVLLAKKDEGSLKATKRAHQMAREGMRWLREEASSGKDLWQLAAFVDYRLRLLGCEGTNILLGSSARGPLRPGYPARIRPVPGSKLAAYIAVQYGRHWGVAGETLSVGVESEEHRKQLGRIREAQKRLASKIIPDTTMGELKAAIGEVGGQADLVFAQDLPLAAGLGFDLLEYPSSADDEIKTGMVLQIALAVDIGESFTAMIVDMLQVTPSGGVWLGSITPTS